MRKEAAIKLFQDPRVRVHWNRDQEKWYFSIIDVIEVLTGNERPRKYWSDLKKKLKNEGSEVSEKIEQLKMKASDGKQRKTDVADTETLLRLIQSIPSPKAEPFKLWLAKVGYERIEETEDPEKAFERAMATYLKKGSEFAILTDEITKAWAGMTTRDYKDLKDLKKENLRDNMTNLELVLNMLAETSTTELSKKEKPKTFSENKSIAKKGGSVAGNARKDLEKKLGESVISPLNANDLRKRLDDNNKKGNRRINNEKAKIGFYSKK